MPLRASLVPLMGMAVLLTAGLIGVWWRGGCCGQAAGTVPEMPPAAASPMGEDHQQARAATAPETSAAELEADSADIFEAHCANCHGPEGSFFGAHLTQLDAAQLRAVVEEMMRGPGGLDPSPAQVDAMTAYLRAAQARDHEADARGGE